MTFAEIIAAVQTALNEAASTYWTSAESTARTLVVKSAINEGYRCLSEATEWYETKVSIPMSAFTDTYINLNEPILGDCSAIDNICGAIMPFVNNSNPPCTSYTAVTWGLSNLVINFLGFRRIFNPLTNRWMLMQDVRDLDERVTPQWRLVTGEPQFTFMRGFWTLGVFPRKSTGSLTCYITAIPPDLGEDGSIPPGLPEEFQLALVEYALYDLLMRAKETAKALYRYQRYLELEEGLRQYVNHRVDKDRIGIFGEVYGG